MTEINEAAKLVAQTADPGARIIFGAYYDKNLKPNQVKITIIASGFNGNGGQPSMLFGATSSHFGERHSVFSSGSAAGETPMAKKTFVSPLAESKSGMSGSFLGGNRGKRRSPAFLRRKSGKYRRSFVTKKKKDIRFQRG